MWENILFTIAWCGSAAFFSYSLVDILTRDYEGRKRENKRTPEIMMAGFVVFFAMGIIISPFLALPSAMFFEIMNDRED